MTIKTGDKTQARLIKTPANFDPRKTYKGIMVEIYIGYPTKFKEGSKE